MNDLYIHQLETENKQLREVLKSTNKVVQEYLEKEKYCDDLEKRINKALQILEKCICSDEWTDIGNHTFIPTGRIIYKSLRSKKVKKLYEILRGKE